MLTGINTNTMEGSEVTFQCNATAVCSRDGRWSPDPGQQVCGFQSGISSMIRICMMPQEMFVTLSMFVVFFFPR